MKKLLAFLFILFALGTSAQGVYQNDPAPGRSIDRYEVRKALHIPTFCGVPNLNGDFELKKAAIAYDSCAGKFYLYNPATATWSITSIDLSNYFTIAQIDSILAGHYTKHEIDSIVAAIPAIPTKVSDLTNDVGYITSGITKAQLDSVAALKLNLSDALTKAMADAAYLPITYTPPAQVNPDWNAASGPGLILNKPTIPTKTSDLTNDVPFLTSASIAGKKDNSDSTNPITGYTPLYQNGLKAAYVPDITSLENYTGSSKTIIVQDSLRGGTFNYISIGVPDSGTVFNAFYGGYWKRQYNVSAAVNSNWFTNIQKAINSSYNWIQIGNSIRDTFIINQNLILKQNLHLTIRGVLLHNPSLSHLLTANAAISATTINVDSANYFFSIGDKIGISDTSLALHGGGDGQTNKVFNSAYVTGVTSSTITIDMPLKYAVSTVNIAIFFKCNNIIVGQNVNNVIIDGSGILDYQKSKSTVADGDPVYNNVEDVLASTGIGLISCDTISISGIEVKNGLLHNIALQTCSNVNIYNLNVHDAHDKNLLVFGTGNNYAINNSSFYNADFEDGVIWHLLGTMNGGDSIRITNCYFGNNGRYGLYLEGNQNVKITDCKFKSNYDNLYIRNSSHVALSNLTFDSSIAVRHLPSITGLSGHLTLDTCSYVNTNSLIFRNTGNSVGFIQLTNGGNYLNFSNSVFENFRSYIQTYAAVVFITYIGSTPKYPQSVFLSNSNYINVDSVHIYRYGAALVTNSNNLKGNQFNLFDALGFAGVNRISSDSTTASFMGSVGIGVSNPVAKLQLGTQAGLNGGDIYSFNSVSSPRFLFGSSISTGSYGGVEWLNADNTIRIFHSTYGIGQSIWKSDGSVTFGNYITSSQYKLSALNSAPSSSTATGTLGEIRMTSGYIYLCTATNTWVRAAFSTW